MKNKLKVGQTFEVVEVLTDGGYSDNVLKIGGFTIDFGYESILANGVNFYRFSKDGANFNQRWASMYKNEIKPIGKLTITKVK